MPQIMLVVANIIISTLPIELAMAVLLVVGVLSSVPVALWIGLVFSPPTLAMLHSLLEVANVYRSRMPFILAVSIRLSILIMTVILVLIRKIICSLPILKRLRPLTLILVSILPLVDPEAPDLIVLPLAHVRIASKAPPDPEARLGSLEPLSVIDLAIGPSVDALAVRLVPREASPIGAAVSVPLEALAVPLV